MMRIIDIGGLQDGVSLRLREIHGEGIAHTKEAGNIWEGNNGVIAQKIVIMTLPCLTSCDVHDSSDIANAEEHDQPEIRRS
jgi:hypothetical protein